MSNEQVERRVFASEDAELRVDGDKEPKIKGYAARFGKWSEDLGGFKERIRAGAFDDVMGDDVRCLRNHDPNLLLGRTTAGTLKLDSNKTGLRFENVPPNTVAGRETIESIRRGDMTGCSFAFKVAEDEWHEDKNENVTRTILKVDRLFDVGPVTYPAYPDTDVATRSLEAWRAAKAAPESEEPEGPRAERGEPGTIEASETPGEPEVEKREEVPTEESPAVPDEPAAPLAEVPEEEGREDTPSATPILDGARNRIQAARDAELEAARKKYTNTHNGRS